MGSSKGEPDNPKLREEVKKEVQNMEKGGGKGSWSAWKAGELARRYEAKGGGYKDKGDNKNKAKKGTPEPKDGSEWGGKQFQKKKDKKEEDDDDDDNEDEAEEDEDEDEDEDERGSSRKKDQKKKKGSK